MCGLLRSESQCVVYTMSTYECLCRWVNFLPFHLIYSLPSPLSPHESLPFAPFLPSPSLSPPFSLHPPCLPSPSLSPFPPFLPCCNLFTSLSLFLNSPFLFQFSLPFTLSQFFYSFSILPSFFNSSFLSLFLNSPFLSLFLNNFSLPFLTFHLFQVVLH